MHDSRVPRDYLEYGRTLDSAQELVRVQLHRVKNKLVPLNVLVDKNFRKRYVAFVVRRGEDLRKAVRNALQNQMKEGQEVV